MLYNLRSHLDPAHEAIQPNSISKSIVTRRRAEDSAVARQGEVDKVTVDLEME